MAKITSHIPNYQNWHDTHLQIGLLITTSLTTSLLLQMYYPASLILTSQITKIDMTLTCKLVYRWLQVWQQVCCCRCIIRHHSFSRPEWPSNKLVDEIARIHTFPKTRRDQKAPRQTTNICHGEEMAEEMGNREGWYDIDLSQCSWHDSWAWMISIVFARLLSSCFFLSFLYLFFFLFFFVA